ncbi:DUF962 domain-containing protein [Reinekea marina]|uniref:DUF962 domain-containing protein n=1 Tax=Reinekea marina TaxID=1310421 RepID=A0ABV7WNM6_9GAMM|nr:Mpo1-like protein [Reinekea marina]MDN3649877.1 DUF962 domain-containing protein [Reinekea marina]
MSRTIEQWLEAYGESHQNKRNKLIHWLCVPAITWTVLALFWSVHLPFSEWANLAVVFSLGALAFYSRISISIALGMVVFTLLCIGLIVWYEASFSLALWKVALSVFVVAWIGQFIGHKIEGKKPSFFEDIQFLLIGPAWLLGFIYKKLGIAL